MLFGTREDEPILAFGPIKRAPGFQAGNVPLPKLGYRVAVYAFCAALVGLELWAISSPVEAFPWSSAPMFARYHTLQDPLYRISFQVEFETSDVSVIEPARALGLGELSIKRLFFGKYYGSTDPRHPQGHHEHDNPRAFAERLRDFSQKVARVYARRMQRLPRAVRIEVSEYVSGRRTRSRLVSRYDVRTQTLTHLPSP